MVYLDLSSRSMLIQDIFEGEGGLWTKGSISWLSINICYYKLNKVQVIYGDFLPFIGVSSGAAYCWAGSWRFLSVWLTFCVF